MKKSVKLHFLKFPIDAVNLYNENYEVIHYRFTFHTLLTWKICQTLKYSRKYNTEILSADCKTLYIFSHIVNLVYEHGSNMLQPNHSLKNCIVTEFFLIKKLN